MKGKVELTERSREVNAGDEEQSDAEEEDAKVDAEEEEGGEDDVEGAELEDDEGSEESASLEPSIRDRQRQHGKRSGRES